jgi:ankyrin repeat protein
LRVTRTKPTTQEKIDTKIRNYCGSLLHWAVLGNHLETVKMLCELGADVLLVIPELEAKAIDIARCNGYVEVYHYLKEREKKL